MWPALIAIAGLHVAAATGIAATAEDGGHDVGAVLPAVAAPLIAAGGPPSIAGLVAVLLGGAAWLSRDG